MIQMISFIKTYELTVKNFSFPLAIKIHQGVKAAILVSILMTTIEAFQNIISIIAYLLLFPFFALNIQKNISTPMFVAALFTITKIWKQPKYHPSVDEQIKQLWDIYTMEFYSAIKEKKILPLAVLWMDLENIMLSEISQSEKDKYMISLICGI